jgi:hypothetical protein
MVRRIKLRRRVTKNVDYTTLGAYRLRIDAIESDGIEERVFVWRRDPVNPYTSEVTNTFFTVASPVDMEEYPPEEPDPYKAYPFFRRSWVDLLFRSVSQAEEAWQLIVQEVNNLITALNKLDTIELEDEVWAGALPDDSSEGSSEGSEG